MARQITGLWADSCEVLHGGKIGLAVGHVDTTCGSKEHPLSAGAYAKAITHVAPGSNGFSAIRRHNRKPRMMAAMHSKYNIERMHQIVELFGPGQAGPPTAVDLAAETGMIPEDRLDLDCITFGVFIHGDAGKSID